ncbi:thioredoxin domain-containing protein 16-like [Tubulanus polymorphus]|uniref:thioredoxin domain-containing protein 16-like n=1 Tax=Tubulanus polymorphus TaxID=672921 RepID=UPI003DA29EBD
MKSCVVLLTIFLVCYTTAQQDQQQDLNAVQQEKKENDDNSSFKDDNTEGAEAQEIRTIDLNELNIFKKNISSRPSNELKVVYFFSKAAGDDKYILIAIKESAQYMNGKYDIELLRYDCDKENAPECSEEDVFINLYVYRQGSKLVALGVDTMFDLSSIVANLLQLYVLDDVKIFRSLADAQYIEPRSRAANQNALIAYVHSFGTYEHMHILETIIENLKKMKFAVTTTVKAVKHMPELKEGADFQCWLMMCKDVAADEPCKMIKYRLPMDREIFSNFVNTSYKPYVVKVNSIDDINAKLLNDPQDEVHILHAGTESIDQLYPIALNISHLYFGQLRVVMIDVNKVNIEHLGYDMTKNRQFPSVALNKLNESMKKEMVHRFSEDNCLKFIRSSFFTKSKNTIALDNLEENIFHDGMDVVQLQDDEVILGMMSYGEPRVIDIQNHWPRLTDKTFPEIMKDNIHLVTYFVSWSQSSSAFLNSLIVANKMYPNVIDSEHVSTVDCSDWTDICSKENITKYPTVQIYSKGKKLQYDGMLDGKSAFSAMKLFERSNPLILKSQKSIDAFINGETPSDLKEFSNVAVFGHLKMHSNEFKAFISLAEKLHGKMLFGLSVDESSTKSCEKFGASYPCIVLLHRNDIQSFVVFDGTPTVDNLLKFVRKQQLPLFSELTTKSFPVMYRRGKPMVILFTDIMNNDANLYSKMVADIAASRKFNEFTFAWMNVHEVDGVATRILEMYIKEIRIPSVALLNKRSNVVFIYEKSMLTETGLIEWLASVRDGKIEPSVVLQKHQFKPLHPGYDVNRLKLRNYETGEVDDNALYNAIQDQEEHGPRYSGRFKGTGRDYEKEEEETSDPTTNDAPDNQIKADIQDLKNAGVLDDPKKKPMGDNSNHEEL